MPNTLISKESVERTSARAAKLGRNSDQTAHAPLRSFVLTPPALAITGSAGHIGGLVAQHLADAGLSQRLLVRDINRAPKLPGATAVTSSYENTEESRNALAGAKLLFMVSASESS